MEIAYISNSRGKAKYMVMNSLNKIVYWTIENVYCDYVILESCGKCLLIKDIEAKTGLKS